MKSTEEIVEIIKKYFKEAQPLGEFVFISEVRSEDTISIVRCKVPEPKEGKTRWIEKLVFVNKATGEIEKIEDAKDDKE